MDEAKELKTQVETWASKIGFRRARQALLSEGLGYNTADLMARGAYKSTPRGLTIDLLRRVLERHKEI